MINALNKIFLHELPRWGAPVLRICLAIVFLWFGILKVIGQSPVEELVMSSFEFLPFTFPFMVLGVFEILIGLGLLFDVALRVTLIAMWLMLAGTFSALVFNPTLFFNGNIFFLTTEGEFVVKNLVLISAGMAIGGYYFRPRV